jgi:rare lipoprotein A
MSRERGKPAVGRSTSPRLFELAAALALPLCVMAPAATMADNAGAAEPTGPQLVIPDASLQSPPQENLATEQQDDAFAAPGGDQALTELGDGQASYYADSLSGNRTADGERYDPADLTAAHRTLPFGSRVRVTNPRTGQSVVVRINDRGPFSAHRVIDLSKAAARRIGLYSAGSGNVRLALLGG